MAQPTAMEWLARSADVQVRVMTLAPGEGTSWHHHRAVTDHVFALDEGIEVVHGGAERADSVMAALGFSSG